MVYQDDLFLNRIDLKQTPESVIINNKLNFNSTVIGIKLTEIPWSGEDNIDIKLQVKCGLTQEEFKMLIDWGAISFHPYFIKENLKLELK